MRTAQRVWIALRPAADCPLAACRLSLPSINVPSSSQIIVAHQSHLGTRGGAAARSRARPLGPRCRPYRLADGDVDGVPQWLDGLMHEVSARRQTSAAASSADAARDTAQRRARTADGSSRGVQVRGAVVGVEPAWRY